MGEWYLYMLRCGDGSLYTGVTTDVERRFGEHASGVARAARYVRGRGPLKVVFSTAVGDRSAALRAELRVKNLTRADKERLVAGQLGGDLIP